MINQYKSNIHCPKHPECKAFPGTGEFICYTYAIRMLYGFTGIQNYQQLWRNTIYLTHSHTISDISGHLRTLGSPLGPWPQTHFLASNEIRKWRNDAKRCERQLTSWGASEVLVLRHQGDILLGLSIRLLVLLHQTSVQRIEIYNIVDMVENSGSHCGSAGIP